MFYVSQSGMEDKNRQWLIDNAYNNHMTPNKDFFNDIDTRRQTRVNFRNGEFTSTSDLGTIGVETKNGKEFICEVIHVPPANQDLLTVGQLMENGYLLNF